MFAQSANVLGIQKHCRHVVPDFVVEVMRPGLGIWCGCEDVDPWGNSKSNQVSVFNTAKPFQRWRNFKTEILSAIALAGLSDEFQQHGHNQRS